MRRVNGFDKAHQLMDEQQRNIIQRIEKRLRRFGYSLVEGRHYPYRCESSVFSEWEIPRE
jgi:hypothetical protein